MKRLRPSYFDTIQGEAHRRWDQLESDPGLAGPWKQLFMQVQSPRHVLSELLQNADDANATWTAARLENGVFYFMHNGEDFDESSFRSLCNFGYSEKRHLHTIGFRGLGFKSTFSLGPRVDVFTPSVAFAFQKNRFTEPKWLDDVPDFNFTAIEIKIEDQNKENWLRENIAAWQESTIPLLFFKNIREIELQDRKIAREIISNGPIANSEWVTLTGNKGQQILRIWSEEENFPADAIAEVRQERGSDELDLPPCKVEILLGVGGPQRLYVVLPTEVQVDLPFSCNAPFIPDPARTGIKDPITSATNRWLLKRVGQLAASTMQEWLRNSAVPVNERVQAYDLLCCQSQRINSLSGNCKDAVTGAFGETLESCPIILAEDGTLSDAINCLDLPFPFLEIWSSEQLLSLFADNQTKVISQHISENVKNILTKWGWLNSADNHIILKRLCEEPYPPVPEYERLLKFWGALQNNEIGFCFFKKDLAIVPVKGKNSLMPAKETVAVSSKERQFSDDEWEFISQHIYIVDPEWIDLLNSPPVSSTEVLAKELLVNLGLDRSLIVETIIRRAAERIFEPSEVEREEGIRLAHIAARMNVDVPDSFFYLCRDNIYRSVTEGLLSESTLPLESILPEVQIEQLTIHSDYDPDPAFRADWFTWLKSAKSRLRRFSLPQLSRTDFYSRVSFEGFLQKHGELIPDDYPRNVGLYRGDFQFIDFNFDDDLWAYWEKNAVKNPGIWAEIVILIASDWDSLWAERCRATAQQNHYGRSYTLRNQYCSQWLKNLRSKQCLLDTHGHFQYPSVLLRMTPQYAHLQKIERFVHPDYDRPENQEFLTQLGVRDRPDNPDVVISRLRTLSSLEKPPLEELLNIYQALDSVLLHGVNVKDQEIGDTFQKEKLIWGEDEHWHTSEDIFQKNDDRIPGMVTIASLFANLGLWARVGVQSQPDIEDALDWLATLPASKTIRAEERSRVEAVLRRAPDSVWRQVGCWLSLDGSWTITNELRWRTISPSTGTNLFLWVRQQTADLSFLDESSQSLDVFAGIPALEISLEAHINRIQTAQPPKDLPEWLRTLAEYLRRIRAEREDDREPQVGYDYSSTRELAQHLLNTKWQEVDLLEITPILEGQPAGEGQHPLIYWHENSLFVRESGPHSHREFIKVFTDVFQNPNLRATIRDCFERNPKWIEQYFATYFSLETLEIEPAQEPVSNEPIQTEPAQKQSIEPEIVSSALQEEPGSDKHELPTPITGKSEQDDITKDTQKEHDRKDRKTAEERVGEIFSQMNYIWQEENNQFIGPRGYIKKDKGPFHWIEYDKGGFRKNQYWVSAKSLDKGVEVPSEIWELMKGSPKITWLILAEEDGHFQPYNWEELQRLIQTGIASLHPATYRLVKNISA